MMKQKIVMFTGNGIHGDLGIIEPCENTIPTVAHQKIAALQKEHEVAVITTCQDTLHEQAGIQKVIHLNDDSPTEEQNAEIIQLLQEADICTLLGCISTKPPIRPLLDAIRPEARLYLCYFNEGEGKMPNRKNLVKAFCASCRSLPDESIDLMINDFKRFI